VAHLALVQNLPDLRHNIVGRDAGGLVDHKHTRDSGFEGSGFH